MKYLKTIAICVIVLLVTTGSYFLARPASVKAIEAARSPQEKLAILNQKAVALTGKPGWVYTRETVTYDIDRENNGVLPNGNVIPKAQVNETWYHVNENGEVFESLTSMFSSDGTLVQTGILKDYYFWNSATGESYPLHSPFILGSFSGDFTSLVDDYSAKPNQLPETYDTEINGRKISVFTIYDDRIGSVVTSDYEQPSVAVKTIAWFDGETGLMVRRQQIITLADGTERTFYDTFTEVRVGAEPPPDVVSQIERQGE